MKRFSETLKWEDDWFVSLPPIQKLVFLFMVDKCDNAGFFEPSPTIHSLMIGISKDEYLGAIQGLKRGWLGAKNPNCKKIFLCNFLRHQRNLPLNPTNNAHKGILEVIQYNSKEFNLNEIEEILGANLGLNSPIGIVKVIKGNKDRGTGERKPKFVPPTLEEFKSYFAENGYKIEIAERAWNGYSTADWHDAKGDPIKNWKQKLQNGWFRPENKSQSSGAMSYDKLKAKGWLNCTTEELKFAYDHQHRDAYSYTEYPPTELLVKAGEPITRAEIDAKR